MIENPMVVDRYWYYWYWQYWYYWYWQEEFFQRAEKERKQKAREGVLDQCTDVSNLIYDAQVIIKSLSQQIDAERITNDILTLLDWADDELSRLEREVQNKTVKIIGY